MDIRTLERTVVDGWIRILRLAIDAGARLVPNGDTGPRNGVQLAVDRADASIRETLGRLIRDEELQTDARRRRAAADERARAIELRIEAQRRKVEADRELAHRQDDTAKLREQAERTGSARSQEAEQRHQQRRHEAQETADKQRNAIEVARAEKGDAANQKAKRERLQILDQQADALDTQAEAFTATDEAQRLHDAAATAKARRKGTS